VRPGSVDSQDRQIMSWLKAATAEQHAVPVRLNVARRGIEKELARLEQVTAQLPEPPNPTEASEVRSYVRGLPDELARRLQSRTTLIRRDSGGTGGRRPSSCTVASMRSPVAAAARMRM
jgi:hypothetical protein